MVRYYDPYMNEYAMEARPSLRAFGIALFFTLFLIGTAALFLIRIGSRRAKYKFSEFSAADHQSTTFTSALLGFLFLAISVFLLMSLPVMLLPTQYILYKYAQLVSFFLLFFVSVYFLLNAAGAPHLVKVKKCLAWVPVLWGMVFMIASYTNPSYLYKDFNHMLCNASLCALTVFFLYEAKSSGIGKPGAAYLVFALITFVTSMAYIVPNFILFAYWELSTELNFIFEAVELGAILYTLAVAVSLIRSLTLVETPESQVESEQKSEAEQEREAEQTCEEAE